MNCVKTIGKQWEKPINITLIKNNLDYKFSGYIFPIPSY